MEVADGVVALLQGGGESGVSNAGFVAAGDGALVVDTMMFPEMAAGLDAELRRRSLRAEMVVNTHHHIDHIGGNAVFAEAPLMALPETVRTVEQTGHPVAIYDGFMSAFRGRFADLEVVPPRALGPASDAPAGAQFHGFTPAHTPGDLAVWVPESRVLFAGDLCFFGVTPLALQGLISGWVSALDRLLDLAPDVVVPGHGPLGGPDDVRLVRDYLAAVLDAGRRAVAEGVELDDAVAAFDAGPVAGWAEAERVLVNLERAMQEARGEISADDVSTLPPSFARLLQ